MVGREVMVVEGTGMVALAIAWLGLGTAALVAGVRARTDLRWLRRGRWVLAVLFLGAGAAVNVWFLATGTDYAGFADGSASAFVREAWRSVVAPNQDLFIGLLVAFEATVGVLVLLGGRRTQVALVAMIAFHVALISFGWGFLAWSLPMLVALTRLLQAQRAADRTPAAEQMPDGNSLTSWAAPSQ